MPIIKITHQSEKTEHQFKVVNPDKLTQAEVKRICRKMAVTALFINGKFYATQEHNGF